MSFIEEESQGLPAEFSSRGRRQMPSLNNLKRAGGRNINGFDHQLCLFNVMSLRGVLSSIHLFGGDVRCVSSVVTTSQGLSGDGPCTGDNVGGA